MKTVIKFQEVKMVNENRIEFRRYDNGRKDSYSLDQTEIFGKVVCPFDKTKIVFDWEYEDFYCPNCKTNYRYTKSQLELDRQKTKILSGLRKEINKSAKTQKKYNLLSKLV